MLARVWMGRSDDWCMDSSTKATVRLVAIWSIFCWLEDVRHFLRRPYWCLCQSRRRDGGSAVTTSPNCWLASWAFGWGFPWNPSSSRGRNSEEVRRRRVEKSDARRWLACSHQAGNSDAMRSQCLSTTFSRPGRRFLPARQQAFTQEYGKSTHSAWLGLARPDAEVGLNREIECSPDVPRSTSYLSILPRVCTEG